MVRLLEKNKTEFLLTVAIIVLDVGVIICSIGSGAAVFKKIGVEKMIKFWKNKDEYKQTKDGCENPIIPNDSKVKVRAYSQKGMYICCFIAGILYVGALAVECAKIFIEISFMAELQWLLFIICRFIIFVLAIAGATCNWDFWERIKKCSSYSSDSDEGKVVKKLKIFFSVVVICATIGLALEVVISLFFKKQKGTSSGEVQSEVQNVVVKEDKVYA